MDHSPFPATSQKAQKRLQKLLPLVVRVKEFGGTMESVEKVAAEAGISAKTLYRNWLEWKRQGENYEALIDRRTFNKNREFHSQVGILPADFVEFWRMLVEQNQRKVRPAYRKLLRMLDDWRAGKIKGIPGYLAPPRDNPKSGVPNGWSYRNLVRLQPTEIQLIAARRGRAAARVKAPLVQTTRVNMEPGYEYQFDDMWLDIHALGPNGKPCRLLTFGAEDYYSGFLFHRGVKPRMKDETGKNRMLEQGDFLFYLAGILSTYGYHPKGTKLVVEHGTAAIPPAVETLLEAVSNGKLRVARSGLGGAPALPGRGREKGGGNPRMKASLESVGNLIHNELADLPGQAGKSRDEKQESTHGDLQESEKLARIEKQSGVQLRHPIWTFEQVIQRLFEVNEHLNRRTDHNMEGFNHPSLSQNEVLIGDVWQPIHSLAGEAREFALKVAKEEPSRFRCRRKSPMEVWKKRRQFKRLHPTILPLLLGEEFAKRLIVRKSLLRLDGVNYIARAVSSDGLPKILNNNEEYLCYLNPFYPQQLIVADLRNRAIGVCQIHERIDRNDVQTIQRQHAQNEAYFADAIAPASRRSAGKVQEVKERHRFNARIIKESGGAPIRKRKISAEEPKISSDVLLEKDD